MTRLDLATLPGLFVVGTDTGVGKTRIAAAIARALHRSGRRVGVLKPVATGATLQPDGTWVADDATRLIAAIDGTGRVATAEACPIAFAEPLAPPVAARRAGRLLGFAEVEDASLRAIAAWADSGAEVVVVEGVGGLLCPIAEGATVIDLAIQLDYPLVVVARRGLGTLNHTLLTVEAAVRRGLRVAGVILNGSDPTADPIAEATNPDELARRLGPIAVLADIPHDPTGLDDGTTGIAGGLDVDRDGGRWYARSGRPRLAPRRPGTPLLSPIEAPAVASSDALVPHPELSPDAMGGSDPDFSIVPPGQLPTPDPEGPRPVVVEPTPAGVAIPAIGSSSGSDTGSGSIGSSSFAVPAGLVIPDPMLGPLDVPALPDEVADLESLRFDRPAASASASPPAEEDGEEVVYVDGPNWPMLLLGSYASAITLALIWWVILPRFRGETSGKPPTSASSPAEPPAANRADRSRAVEPAPPIPADRLVEVGKPLVVGSLEVTPLGVDRRPITLARTSLTGRPERRDGGKDALVLRVKLRNVSKDAVFAPLDESYVREGDDGASQGFVQLGEGGERVYLYPLPVSSEWTIVGQEFPTLRPGEVRESFLATGPEAPTTFPPGTTWHLRFRTGLDATAVVGVAHPARP